jgi:AraC-like DNA-binding protein
MAGVEAMSIVTEHTFPRHAHDQFGVGVMTSGAQRSWSGIGAVESTAGDIIMVNPGEMHDGAPVGGARGWRIVYFEPALAMRETAEDGMTGDLVMRPVARDPQLANDVHRLIDALGSPTRDAMAAEEAFLRCLMRASRRHGVDGPAQARRSPPVNRAIRRLEEAPEKAASLADLAALSGVSRFQLLRGFFREAGATPHAYLVQLRVRLARRHLAAGASPAETAALAGFADQSHLTRAFVRQFGVTPSRYRAAIR